MEINDYITGAISLIAIIISAVAFVQSLKSQKRQLRIEKIEEILEITHILNTNYQYFEDTQIFKIQLISGVAESSEKNKYLAQVKTLKKISDEIDIRNKLSRLYILNNSYLPKKELKDKIGVFITVYTCIAESTLSQPTEKIDLPYNEFPKKLDFLEFAQEVQNELIAEMSLGYKNNIIDNNTFEKKFRERYNL